GKIYKKLEEAKQKEKDGLSISKDSEIEWGNQIRSYVLHPYKMVKDHRTNLEIHNVEAVLENGDLDDFIEAEKDL
ncbi:MAG: peptide chain release factor 2, partial [Candidatus Pacebacteria bacterium]|nr:peptide chain release factor 2 [Candidatus Paceibacterota bacterium]